MWYVYIVKCADGTFYTGVTNNLDRRVFEHNNSTLGSKYTKARRPVSLVYSKRHRDRSGAQKNEHQIKNFTRDEKIRLINKKNERVSNRKR